MFKKTKHKNLFHTVGFLDLRQKGAGLSMMTPDSVYSDYAFYVDFADGTGRDRVSNTSMQTVLSAGRVKPDGTPLGMNEPCIQDSVLNSLGQIELLNGMTDDISNAYWFKKLNTTVLSANSFICSAYLAGVTWNNCLTAEGVSYTISFYAYVSNISRPNFRIQYWGSPTPETSIVLTGVRKRYSATFSGKVGGGAVAPGLLDINTSNWATVYIDTINITKSAYLLPPVHNATINPITIPHGYSDADEGYKWPLASCPKLLTALQGTAGNNAQGTIEVEWIPQFSSNIPLLPVNVSVVNQTGTPGVGVFYISDTDFIKTYDGVNTTAKVTVLWVENIRYKVTIIYGPHPEYANALKYQISVTDGTTTWESPITNFDGSFNPTTHLSIGYDNSYWQQLKSIKVLPANPFNPDNLSLYRVTEGDLRIATANGEAMFYHPTIDFSQFAGTDTGGAARLIQFEDSAGLKATAYCGARGGGETLGSDVFAGWSLLSGWTAINAIINDSDTFTTTAAYGYVAKSVAVTAGSLILTGISSNQDIGVVQVLNAIPLIISPSDAYSTTLTGNFRVRNTINAAVTTITKISCKKLTDVPTTGLHLLSAQNGTTRNMATQDVGFNPNGIVGVTVW